VRFAGQANICAGSGLLARSKSDLREDNDLICCQNVATLRSNWIFAITKDCVGSPMWFVWSALVLALLRYFEVGVFATVSWWWVFGLLAAAFVWFEFIERFFGLEKKKAMDEMEAARKARIKRALEQDRPGPR